MPNTYYNWVILFYILYNAYELWSKKGTKYLCLYSSTRELKLKINLKSFTFSSLLIKIVGQVLVSSCIEQFSYLILVNDVTIII